MDAHSTEGIVAIQIVTGGSDLVSEKNCESETPKVDCQYLSDEWVTDTGSFPPGIVHIEVITTDRLGQSASERFWVNIPYTPPPAPGVPEAPRFRDIMAFREEFGLDLDLRGDEEAINSRIFNLIGDWHNPQTPSGEVARATMERWGVPLRAKDAAELEYREWFYNLNAERIDQWVDNTTPSNFAGYYIDHASGGIMHIGFLDNQPGELANLLTALSLAAEERLQVYPTTPTVSYLSVEDTAQAVSDAVGSNATLGDLVIEVSQDEAGKTVRVGASDVTQVGSILDQMFGPTAPITVEYDAGGIGTLLSGRYRDQGRMRAGDAIFTKFYTGDVPPKHTNNSLCTAGFGAKDRAGTRRGHPFWRLFVLTAGHCNRSIPGPGSFVYRSTNADYSLGTEGDWKLLGEVTRNAFSLGKGRSPTTDAEAIRVKSAGVVPQGTFWYRGWLWGTKPAATARKGNTVCFSGVIQKVSCGQIVRRSSHLKGTAGTPLAGYLVKFHPPALSGDSGAPVLDHWGRSIGLVSAGVSSKTLVQPLLTPRGMNPTKVPGVLKNPLLQPLSLKLGQ